MLINVGKSQI